MPSGKSTVWIWRKVQQVCISKGFCTFFIRYVSVLNDARVNLVTFMKSCLNIQS